MTAYGAIADQPEVVTLDDRSARSGELGAKAANLAMARAAGLPVIDGFVIPPAVATAILAAPHHHDTAELGVVRGAWASLSRNGRDPVVVRSSSLAEDTEGSSQAVGMASSMSGSVEWKLATP